VEAWRLTLHAQFDAALQISPLPELPDYQRVDRFIIDVRRRIAAGERP
jgi:hypothetical protein